jgi:cellulose synthase/poly-beta-1,6-N-acetylglucosamine synthase-like glycosyltransferase
MKQPKISFLIAAHNEGKIIEKTLNNLLNLPYKNYEVIIGLDGCTDNTEEIVKKFCKKSEKFKYYKLNLREGKPAVINKIIKKAKGEIIIINDADWVFKVENKKELNKFLSIFNDPLVGAIAESFPITYPTQKNDKILKVGVTIQNFMWISYIKSNGQRINQYWIVSDKNSFPLLTNIFRKNLYVENETLGDDFERSIQISKAGYKILATNNPRLPRMISVGEKYTLKDLLKQKERTALARLQLKSSLNSGPFISWNFFLFFIKKSLKLKLKELIGFFILNIIFTFSTLKSRFRKKISIKDGWKMRISR